MLLDNSVAAKTYKYLSKFSTSYRAAEFVSFPYRQNKRDRDVTVNPDGSVTDRFKVTRNNQINIDGEGNQSPPPKQITKDTKKLDIDDVGKVTNTSAKYPTKRRYDESTVQILTNRLEKSSLEDELADSTNTRKIQDIDRELQKQGRKNSREIATNRVKKEVQDERRSLASRIDKKSRDRVERKSKGRRNSIDTNVLDNSLDVLQGESTPKIRKASEVINNHLAIQSGDIDRQVKDIETRLRSIDNAAQRKALEQKKLRLERLQSNAPSSEDLENARSVLMNNKDKARELSSSLGSLDNAKRNAQEFEFDVNSRASGKVEKARYKPKAFSNESRTATGEASRRINTALDFVDNADKYQLSTPKVQPKVSSTARKLYEAGEKSGMTKAEVRRGVGGAALLVGGGGLLAGSLIANKVKRDREKQRVLDIQRKLAG